MIYETITLTTLAKRFKFSEKSPHAVYSFVIFCSRRENILSFLHIRMCCFLLKAISALEFLKTLLRSSLCDNKTLP